MTAPAHKRPFRKRDEELDRYINLKLAALGQPVSRSTAGSDFLEIAGPLLRNYYQKDQLLGDRLCASDTRIQDFLDAYLSDVCPQGAARLPANTFVLDREGMAPRHVAAGDVGFLLLAVPGLLPPAAGRAAQSAAATAAPRRDCFTSSKAGFPFPPTKLAVPKQAFAALLGAALRPSGRSADAALHRRPGGAGARCFVSLLLRPLVCPAAGTDPAKTMEIRFFAPGSLVSNLDFVESIFGNGGDPYLPENDAALDVLHWTGHTGCVILAPHLVGIPKKALGLPHVERGHRTPAPRRHVLDATKTNPTTTAAPSR